MVSWLYVNSKEGLRVRESDSLSGEKITKVPYGMKVKPVAVGKKATIDDIDDYWVEILIPRYLWKGTEPEYGWVFGGYLTIFKPEFTTDNWTKNDLAEYLTSYISWSFYDKYAEWTGFMHFYKDGTFEEFHPARGDPGFKDESWSDGYTWHGTWKALDGHTFSVNAITYAAPGNYSRKVEISVIYDNFWGTEDYAKGKDSLFLYDQIMGNACYEIKTIRDGSVLNCKGVYFEDAWGELYINRTYDSDENYEMPDNLKMEYIKAGINVDSEIYKKYWEKVIKDHMND